MGAGLRSDRNKLAGGYAARGADQRSRRVLRWRARGAHGKFSAFGLADLRRDPAQRANGGFPPFSLGRSGDVARLDVARLAYVIGLSSFFRCRTLIANLTSRPAARPSWGRSTARRRVEAGGRDPLGGLRLTGHLRRVDAFGRQATFCLWPLGAPEKNRNLNHNNGVGGYATKRPRRLSALGREATGAAWGQGSRLVFITGGQAPLVREGGGDVN